MTENQAEPLYTATVEFRRPGVQQWEITAQATDTLGGLVEWAAPAQEALQRPQPPLNTEKVQEFISAAFGPLSERQRVRVEPAAEDAKSTLDVLEEFVRRRESGTVTVEDCQFFKASFFIDAFFLNRPHTPGRPFFDFTHNVAVAPQWAADEQPED